MTFASETIVRYGSLVILEAGVVSVAYSPGEWLRVNVQ
jgi:hypothetical protein